ncbi:hypothetical protein SAMN02745245_00627 [Anaerosphaera aminiphila DSM 21120]|uniref:Uncharacterized protein n=1 Tax=Anaerosphaera aminiphila DSM 21120 TaxID=1120995 RepID=A0A1M5QFB9_9FIRM|nr:hypothetical protein [Anaerosphaera aminiphila]SHH12536.1 hypothetical protein SAMN02745245_00627 [Anaerosphaera aminiphila DSM 21120]
MNNFVRELFSVETIEHPKLETLSETLEIIQDDYLELLVKNYYVDDEITRNQKISELNEKIKAEFRERLLKFSAEEHKSFNEFYNGVVDYSDENVYVNLKKFTNLGMLFLFTINDGKLYTFKIPDELCVVYEEMLKNS